VGDHSVSPRPLGRSAKRLSSKGLIDDPSQGVQLATIQELARY
jgi:hypothetical protein